MNESVFLSYATPDRSRVLPFYDFLLSQGFFPWMDVKQLLPGQNWEFEVRKAIDSALLIIVFISERSVNRTGYVQKELHIALNKLQERPFSHIYLVPVILDRETTIPLQLSDLHCLYADLPDCFDQLSKTLKYQIQQTALAQDKLKKSSEINFTFEHILESWEGSPGYELDITLPHYSSDKYPNIGQASDIIKGSLLSSASAWRIAKLEQCPEYYSKEKTPFTGISQFHVECQNPFLRGSILSQHSVMHWYGAGAAHPNTNFRSWAFFLDPLIHINSLSDCFSNPKDAFKVIQSEIRQQLTQTLLGAPQVISEDDWIATGTSDWSKFAVFTFEKDYLVISFDPYQVASFAEGAQFVQIPYTQLNKLMKQTYLDALNVNQSN